MSKLSHPDPYIPHGLEHNTLIIQSGPRSFSKIYCRCGRIVDYDSKEYRLKMKLKKPLECSCCRNQRISRELDEAMFGAEGVEVSF